MKWFVEGRQPNFLFRTNKSTVVLQKAKTTTKTKSEKMICPNCSMGAQVTKCFPFRLSPSPKIAQLRLYDLCHYCQRVLNRNSRPAHWDRDCERGDDPVECIREKLAEQRPVYKDSGLYPPPPPTSSYPLPPFSPSQINLMVSVDVKHHVYLGLL